MVSCNNREPVSEIYVVSTYVYMILGGRVGDTDSSQRPGLCASLRVSDDTVFDVWSHKQHKNAKVVSVSDSDKASLNWATSNLRMISECCNCCCAKTF